MSYHIFLKSAFFLNEIFPFSVRYLEKPFYFVVCIFVLYIFYIFYFLLYRISHFIQQNNPFFHLWLCGFCCI